MPASHLEANPLRTQLSSLHQQATALEAQLAAWQSSEKPLMQAIYQEAAIPLTQHHESRILELEEQLQGERRELATITQSRDERQQLLVELEQQCIRQLADLRKRTKVLKEKQGQQAEGLAVLPLAQLDEGSVHLLLESLGFEVCYDVIASNSINGAEIQAMNERDELFEILEITTVGKLKRLSQALRDHGQDEQKAVLGVRAWSILRVQEWAQEARMSLEVCQALRTHEVDGGALMNLNRHDMPLLGIESLSDRRRLLSQVEVVKKESLSEAEIRSPEAPLPQSEVLEIVLQHNTGLNEELKRLRQRVGDTK